jgi:hypothetical protein
MWHIEQQNLRGSSASLPHLLPSLLQRLLLPEQSEQAAFNAAAAAAAATKHIIKRFRSMPAAAAAAAGTAGCRPGWCLFCCWCIGDELLRGRLVSRAGWQQLRGNGRWRWGGQQWRVWHVGSGQGAVGWG